MKTYLMPIIGGVAGIACGLASNTPWLAGKWANLIVWAVAGIALGLFVDSGRQMVWTGVVYGFLMSVTFLISGFGGTSDKLPAFLVLTLLLSVLGALGGLAAVFIGSRLRRLVR